MAAAITVENLGKRYRVSHQARAHGGRHGYKTLRDTLANLATAPLRRLRGRGAPAGDEVEDFWALKDVSFEVQPGEVVGIIGRNGAGKSTLLKILSRITKPTSGQVRLNGRVGSLLEVGTGFHPELTGRENIYLSGSILGMSRAEIDRKFDEIVAFAEVEKFLDTPVKRYSSGMYVRLAFAVATYLEPEILFIDEVLAVGDASFQKRCIDRMSQLAVEGRTILFVSHNMQLIPRFCQRAVLLNRGSVAAVGDAGVVTEQYLNRLLEDSRTGDLRHNPRTGDGRARFVHGCVVGTDGEPMTQFVCGDDLCVRMTVESSRRIEHVALAAVIQSVHGVRVITSWTQEVGFDVTLRPGTQVLECRFRNVNLRPGHSVLIDFWMAAGGVIDSVERAVVVDVVGDERHAHLSTNGDQGVVVCDYSWRAVG